jgi:hypothetical protein
MGMRARLTVLGLVVVAVLLLVAPAAPAMTVNQVARLVAADPVNGDAYGFAVAASGDTVLVGDAYRTVDSLAEAGVVYVYTNGSGGWTQAQLLTASDPAALVGFGTSVAVEGDTLAVGAPGATMNGVPFGAVYLYKNVNGVWTFQQKLMASDPQQAADFGSSVSLDGDQLAVGCPGFYVAGPRASRGFSYAPGAAYVFSRANGTWSQTAKLQASEGTAGLHMGYAVAISGDTVMAGAPGLVGVSDGPRMASRQGNISPTGRVLVFTHAGGSWAQTQVIQSGATSQDDLGISIALAGDESVIGAPGETIGTNKLQGAAYVYTRSGGVWNLAQKLTRADGAALDFFGIAVARSGPALAVSDAKERDGDPSRFDGALYVYTKVDGLWAPQASAPKPAAAAASEVLGFSVALSGSTLVAGAPYEDKYDSVAAGAAYVFSLTDTVTASVSGEHGAVTPSGSQAVPIGSTPTFTFAPESGYAVAAVVVDGAAVTPTGANAYTFAPVYADHTISVSFDKMIGPTTNIEFRNNIWFRKPIKIIFNIEDMGPRAGEASSSRWDGKGMPPSSTEYRIGKSKWKLGTRCTVRRQGVTRIYARSSDARGVVGPTAKGIVRIDYTTPLVTGYGRPQDRSGKATSFRFKIKDKPTKWVRAMLAVTRYGYPEQQYPLGKVPTGRAISRSVKLDLGVGTWSWRIVVRDPAGNRGLCRWRYLDVSP